MRFISPLPARVFLHCGHYNCLCRTTHCYSYFQTHLGHGVMVATSRLNYILGARGDSMFCKEATKVVFGSANLQRQSATGQACRRLKGSAAKRARTPNKLAAVGSKCFSFTPNTPCSATYLQASL